MNVPMWFVVTCSEGEYDDISGPYTQDYALDICPESGHADRHCYVAHLKDFQGSMLTDASQLIAEFVIDSIDDD